VASNEQARKQDESSEAEFIFASSRSRVYFNEELSQAINQNASYLNSRPDLSRNDILPAKTVLASVSPSESSDFSDIRGKSSGSSLQNEAKVHVD
jgi:hypothetical protein